MTSPAPETLEREQDKLLLTDIEIGRKLGVPERTCRAALEALDSNPKAKFPPKLELWGGRRWWPHVRRWFDDFSGKLPNGAARLITETPDELRNRLLRRFPTAEQLRSSKHDRTNAAENT